jgi:hypothetical protein
VVEGESAVEVGNSLGLGQQVQFLALEVVLVL